jgi:hypothetical protein
LPKAMPALARAKRNVPPSSARQGYGGRNL